MLITKKELLEKMEQLTKDEERLKLIGEYCVQEWILECREKLATPINLFEGLCSAYVMSYRISKDVAKQFIRDVYLLSLMDDDRKSLPTTCA